VRLQEALWGSDRELRGQYLRWKYLENPYLEAPLMRLVLMDETVVAMRGMYGARWHVGSERQVTIPVAGDTVIHEDHQSRGLFRLINAALVEGLRRSGFDYAFNLSAGIATSLRSRRAGWTLVPGLTIVRRHGTRRGRKERLKSALTDLVSATRLSEVPEPEAMEDVCSSTSTDRPQVRHVRDREYFSWRFRNPTQRYRFLWYDAGATKAYLVLALDEGGAKTASIVDWEAPSEETAARLLAAAIKAHPGWALRAWAGPLVRTWETVLGDHGFEPEASGDPKGRFEPGVLVVASTAERESSGFDTGGLSLVDPASWDLRMLYSDDF